MAECRLSLIRGSESLGDWLAAYLASLPRRLTRAATLVLPSHRLAHRLRREAGLRGEPGLLAGERMRGPEELAREILLRASVEARPALPALRVRCPPRPPRRGRRAPSRRASAGATPSSTSSGLDA